MKYIRPAACCLFALLASCTDVKIRDDIIADPDPQRFSVCYNTGCSSLSTVSLKPHEWQRVRNIFRPPSKSPRQERERIRKSVAMIETYVGKRTGTQGDLGGNLKGMFAGSNQMDCIDESNNTASYIKMMLRDKLLRWHVLKPHTHRYPSLLSYPHTSAVIEDTSSKQQFAVDSWFRNNGQLPDIVPLNIWKKGWSPRKSLSARAK